MRNVAAGAASRLILAAALAGCGAGGMGAASTVDPNTWTDGTTFAAAVDVPAGTTVTIAPGAHLLAGPKVLITVHGTLKVASATGPHARIGRGQVDTAWEGILVESGGTLDAEGLDLDGATTSLDLRAGATGRYDTGTISDPSTPINLDGGARLDTAHAVVTGATSASGISGEFHASYLDYAKTIDTGGFVIGDAHAIFDLTDSSLHGEPGANGADYITAFGAALVHVAYTTITDAHCGFHFGGPDRFEIDHVTVGASSPTGAGGQNVWGAMLYGSGPGPNVISDSNFMNTQYDLDESGTNGPLTITGFYTTGQSINDDLAWSFGAGQTVSAPVLDAKPR